MGIPPTIETANLGMADSLILMVMALVVFGPRRLPQIGRQIGKLMYEFRKASNDFKFQMEEELRNAEEADRRKKEEEERQRQLAAAAPPAAQLEASVGAQVVDSLVVDSHASDSQVSESRPGAPEDSSTAAANTAASSSTDDLYSDGDTYGELAEAQVKTLTKVPTIQPPVTGAPVPAEWPASDGAETSTAGTSTAETITVKSENEAKETAAEEASKAAEPAHNG
jgi:sec-independent protein translocase protein TatB